MQFKSDGFGNYEIDSVVRMRNMSRWFIINGIFILFVIWKVATGNFTIPLLFGVLGFCFFMINWMRHAMFATIRSKIDRKRKIMLAKFSKRAMPFHKWTGTIAFIFILVHMILMVNLYGFQMNNFKMMFGLMACLLLFLTVIMGWFRFYRTTIRKRIWHLSFAFTLFYIIIIHIAL